MDIISEQACEKCTSLKRCIETAMYHPELQIRCVHFRYITKQMNELTNTLENGLANYLIWDKERMNYHV